MQKVIRENKVAVIISVGFGAGWYTWSNQTPRSKALLFHPKLVEMVEQGRRNEITEEWLVKNLRLKTYCGGTRGLIVVWLPVGTKFIVREHDGYEEIFTEEDLTLKA